MGGRLWSQKIPGDPLPQPAPLDGDRLMHAPPQRRLDRPQRRPHAIAAALPPEQEGTPAGSPAAMREAQEAEGLRFAKPAPDAVRRREAAELEQASLVRMQRQRKRL